MNKVLAVASSKGGVGKTTVAINVACALVGFGRQALVVEGDLQAPNLGMHLGSTVVPISVNTIIKRGGRVLDAIYLHQSGVRVLPGDIGVGDGVEWIHHGLQFVVDECRGQADMVFLDCPPGAGANLRSVVSCADAILAVTTPDLVAATDTLKTIKLARSLRKEVIGVVVNNAFPGAELSPATIASLMEVPVVGCIPHDTAVLESLQLRHPVVYSHPDSTACTRFKEIAAFLVGSSYESGTFRALAP